MYIQNNYSNVIIIKSDRISLIQEVNVWKKWNY